MLVVTLGVIGLVMFPALLFKQASAESLGIVQILRIAPYIIPEVMRYTVPAAMLFAGCLVFGRLAGHNELVAIKAAGISPMAILWPVLAVSTLISLGLVYLNDVSVSWGRTGIRRVIIDSVEEMAYSKLRTDRSFSRQQFSINVRRVEGRRLVQPTITFPAGDSSDGMVTIQAEWAELRADPVADTLTIELHNGSVVSGEVQAVFPDTVQRVLPLSDASGQSITSRRAADLPLSALPQANRRQRKNIRNLEQSMAAKAAFEIFTGQFENLDRTSWKRDNSNLTKQRSQLARLRTEPHRRWSDGFSCLCFVMVGIPLAIRRRNSDFLTSFFLVFMPIVLFYYPFLIYGLDQAKDGALPPWSVWFGNAALLLVGVYLLRRVRRY